MSIKSNCVSHLPHSVNELWSLARESSSSLQTVTRENKQLRMFPNVTFNCSGSIVGWSMIASQRLSKKGGRPKIFVWKQVDLPGMGFQQGSNESRLLPCLKRQDRNFYLYENITEQPVEFEQGDILGMLLHSPNKVQFEPYFVPRESFVSYYRMGQNAQGHQKLDNYDNDTKMPLLFLHICKLKVLDMYDIVRILLQLSHITGSKEDGEMSYQRCIRNYTRYIYFLKKLYVSRKCNAIHYC